MDVTISLDVDVIHSEAGESYEINGAWIGEYEITNTALMDDLREDLDTELEKRRKQVLRHRFNGSWRGIPREAV